MNNAGQCRQVFELLFCTPDASGTLKSSGSALLTHLGGFLTVLDGECPSAGSASAADQLNALCRISGGDSGFPELWARELFDALAELNIFPADLEDAETGKISWLDAASEKIRNLFNRNIHEKRKNVTELFLRAKVDVMELFCGEDPVVPLMKFFRMRQRKG